MVAKPKPKPKPVNARSRICRTCTCLPASSQLKLSAVEPRLGSFISLCRAPSVASSLNGNLAVSYASYWFHADSYNRLGGPSVVKFKMWSSLSGIKLGFTIGAKQLLSTSRSTPFFKYTLIGALAMDDAEDGLVDEKIETQHKRSGGRWRRHPLSLPPFVRVWRVRLLIAHSLSGSFAAGSQKFNDKLCSLSHA